MKSSNSQEGWSGPLAGLRVIDLTRVLAGPFAPSYWAILAPRS